MNKKRIENIIQYALLIAGQEDDFFDRSLGPIHFIKYVYLADLNYARHNNGETYTGIAWRFHTFGPWSNAVNEIIDPSLDAIGVSMRKIQSQYEGCDDYKRWSYTNDRLLDEVGSRLPLVVSGQVASSVHQFKSDTPRLLEHVYQTPPMLGAAPGDLLDFSTILKRKKSETDKEALWEALSARKKKKFKMAIKAAQEKRAGRGAGRRKGFVDSPLADVRDDAVLLKGLDWMESLAGAPLPDGDFEAAFSDEVWHSETRKEEFPE